VRTAETTQAQQYADLVAASRAARAARDELETLHADLDAHDLFAAPAHRLHRILERWDHAGGSAR
jgi:hypothetical protein